jgi:hypothetical protein
MHLRCRQPTLHLLAYSRLAPSALLSPFPRLSSVTMAALKSVLMLLLAAVAAFVMAAPMAEAKGVSLFSRSASRACAKPAPVHVHDR